MYTNASIPASTTDAASASASSASGESETEAAMGSPITSASVCRKDRYRRPMGDRS
jgi:hypothetical protein